MKRDLDLIVKILLAIEDASPAEGWHDFNFSGTSDDELSYHIKLLHEAGLIDAVDTSTQAGFEWHARDLTWRGHDFLDQARSASWLDEIKSRAEKEGLDLIFAGIKYGFKKILGSEIDL